MRTKYSIKNFILQLIANIISIIFLFATHTVFIKILGVEYNGLNGLFINIITFLSLLELGISNAITYNLYKYVKDNDIETIKSIMFFYKKAYRYIALLILIAGLLVMPFLQLIIHDVSIDINIYIAYLLFMLSTVATYILAYKRNIIIADQKNYIISIVQIIYIVILNSLQIVILFFTKDYYLFLIIKIVCAILENIVINTIANKMYGYLKDKNVKALKPAIKNAIISRIKALIIHKSSWAVTSGTDNILISVFLGIKTVGLYTCYNYIITSVRKVFGNIIQTTTSSIGNLLVEKDYEKNYITFKKIHFLNFWIAVDTSVCLLLITQPFITLWVGKKYLLDFSVLLVLVLNYFQMMMRSTYGSFKDAAGIWVEDKYVPLIQLSINLISSILLLKFIGLKGVFIGTIICNFTVWFYSYPKFIYKELLAKNAKKYYLDLFTYLSIFLVILGISWLINLLSINIITSILISMIIPNAILLIIFGNSSEFKYYKSLIFRRK